MRYVSPAEQEHIDFVAGCASEFQNSHFVSSLETSAVNADVRGQIHHFVESGQFVVVESSPAYCRVTDAICGEHLSIRSVWGDRKAAERAVQALYDSGSADPEASLYVFPHDLAPAPVAAVDEDDGVPF